jgi:hypothetical protein
MSFRRRSCSVGWIKVEVGLRMSMILDSSSSSSSLSTATGIVNPILLNDTGWVGPAKIGIRGINGGRGGISIMTSNSLYEIGCIGPDRRDRRHSRRHLICCV